MNYHPKCDRCGNQAEGVRFWAIGQWGLLCHDCNLEAGIFYSIVVDVMLDFAGYIEWHYKRVTQIKPIRMVA